VSCGLEKEVTPDLYSGPGSSSRGNIAAVMPRWRQGTWPHSRIISRAMRAFSR
jgi:hypothetical protein